MACFRNIRTMANVGDAEYDAVRSILAKIENPVQLRLIEEASPQIIGHDEELWREFIKRDVANWEIKLEVPDDPQEWYLVYEHLCITSQKEIDEDARLLKASLDGIKKKQADNTAQQVELSAVKLKNGMKPGYPVIKLPRNSTFFRKELNTKHFDKDMIRQERELGLTSKDMRINREREEKDRRTPAQLVTKNKMSRFRKDAKAMSRFSMLKPPESVSTSRKIKALPATVLTPPPALLHDYRRRAPPKPVDTSIPPPAVFNPRKRKIEHANPPAAEDSTTEQREKRLKAFTNPSSISKQPSLEPASAPKTIPSPHQLSSIAASSSSTKQCLIPKTLNPSTYSSPSKPSLTSSSPSSSPLSQPTITSSSPRSSTNAGTSRGVTPPRASVSSPKPAAVGPIRRIKKRAEASPFMPVKKRARVN